MLDLPCYFVMRPLFLLRATPALATAALMLALCGGAARAAGEDTHAAVLHACPKVQQEIVDLDMLAEGLKDSGAVGMFEKLRLKSAIDELIGRFKAFHRGATQYTLAELQEQYDLLMMRIAASCRPRT